MGDLVNPYIAGAPVTEQRMFFGREDIFKWIQNSITGQYGDHILVVHGQRRVGKTSVLKQLGNRLPGHYIPVFFDLQGRTHTTLDRFLWWLAREIVRVLKQDRDIDLPIHDKDEFTQDLEFFENRFLPDLKPVLAGNTLLLTFDEFDNLEESEVKEELARPLVDYLRRLMGRDSLNFIFSIGSSGRKLENMQAAYTEFFKAALYKKISFLNEEQTYHLVTLPVRDVLTYERAAVEYIYKIASGHPYFTQLTCHELFARCQQTEQRAITKGDVDAILDDVVERGTVNLKFVWDEATDIEKWALAALANLENPDSRTLTGYLRKNRVRFTDSDLTSGLLHLREKDVLTQDNQFVIHLLKRWLQKNRPIEQVREELTEVNPIANRYIEIGLEFKDARLYEKAINSFQEALDVSKDNIQAQVNIALTYVSQKMYDKAVVEFEKALAIDDEDVSARAGLCDAHLALGDSAMSKGREKEAALSYQRVLAVNAEHTEARGRMAEIAHKRAEEALPAGRDEEALSAFAEALKYTPEDEALSTRFEEVKKERREKVLSALLARAEKELSAKNWESAIRTLQEGLQLSPEDERFKERLATAKEKQRAAKLESCLARASQAELAGKWEAAVAALQEYLSFEADQQQVRERLDKARRKLHEIELRELRERARSFSRSERWEESLTAWDEVLLQEPADPSARSEREAVEKNRALAGSYAEAQSAFAKRNFDKAITLFKNIVMEDADYKEATRLLAESVELRRATRKWWQNRWALGGIGIIALIAVTWGVFRFGLPLFAVSPTVKSTEKFVPSAELSTATAVIPPTSFPTPLPLKWTRLNSGQFLQRDQVNAIAFDPSDPGVIYAGTQNAGIYKSIDGGLSWQPILTGLKDEGIDTIIVDPDNPQTVYASALASGVYKSTDGGASWQLTTNVIGSWWRSHLVMSPNDSSVLYFSTGYEFFKTADGGATWERMIVGCPLGSGVTSMVVLPDGELLVGVYEGDSCEPGIYKSDQGSTTWSLLRSFTSDSPWFNGLAVDSTGEFIYSINHSSGVSFVYSSSNSGQDWTEPISMNCTDIAVQPGNGSIAYCGTEDGAVYQTQNGGKDWEFLGAPNAGPVKAIVFPPNDAAQKIFAGGNGLYFSSDGGHSWSDQGNGLGGKFFELSIHPITQAFYIQQVASNTGNNVIYRSNDNGADWQSFKKGCMLNFGADGVLHCWYWNSEVSYDDGVTWSGGSNRFGGDVAYPNPYKAEEFFGAPFDGGIVSSRDGGQTWQEVNAGIKFDNAAFFFASDQNRIYLIDLRSDWSYTSANGDSWTPCNSISEFDFSNTQTRAVIDPRDSAKIYVATQGSGVVVSADACSSWAPTNNGLDSLFVNSLTQDSNNPGTIYAGTDDGAYVSYNGGSSWAKINDGLLGATVVYSIAVDQQGTVYAATPYGIFKLEGK